MPIEGLELPGFRRIGVPQDLQSHPLIRGRFFYTLPLALLRILKDGSTRTYLDPSLDEVESKLSAICGDHTAFVGFWRNDPVCYRLLYDATFEMSGETADSGDAFASHHLNARAYAGWLVTNPLFVDEKDHFFQTCKNHLSNYGFPLYISQRNIYVYVGVEGDNDGALFLEFKREYDVFLKKWRLESIPGTSLPSPLMTHEILFQHGLSVNQLRGNVMGISVPDIAPLPPAEVLRKKLEDASQRLPGPEYLRGWMAIVKNENKQRTHELDRFQRLFRLVHFWRVVHQRHQKLKHLALGHRYAAFGQFLNVSEATVRADLEMVQDKLGKGWHLQSL